MSASLLQSPPLFEFHISRKARDFYGFDGVLFSIRGDTVFANFQGAHLLADRINKKRQLLNLPAPPVQASHLYAAGLIDEILHFVMGRYRAEKSPDIFERLNRWLNNSFGESETDRLLLSFADNFPSSYVYERAVTSAEYLSGKSDGVPNRYIILEELVVLWLGNLNLAYSPIHELIDDADIESASNYRNIMDGIESFFRNQPRFGPDKQYLIDMLRSPALHSPHSLTGQFEFMRDRWGTFLSDFILRMLKGMDFIKEEEKIRFDGPGISAVPSFADAEYEIEPERFSADLHWMPNVVLIAKCTYVWLDQLSKKYGRDINRLDQIPDEELDRLAGWGFTGLWLIGLWERSRASRRIKHICGNPEAVASAYSLLDYSIAGDLGGYEAYCSLRDRAWLRGIRLASDMVPNHMGIDSKWVIERPDWFIQSDHPPFPSYTFGGHDLSDDERVGVFVEDGYLRRTDAAVAFKRLDRYTGDVRYIYHGNDGTQMPWNDTAQLNFLKAEVREAVIQTTLHVARMFPIIRFDAAMTLAKRHYQRLWFPEPGTGGDIPSRSEHAMTKEDFNRAFPVEFWREVVDRVQQEAPDTLLMAEAFWMMEGYFVRTLGMHRVYNSAFMNMLKNEENAKYREYIKKVLEFNPQILKRYVNFMNNPDEETAVAQFGKDDKYFGACIMMATMPGLPMFGHGQIEGFAEKYGMEYRRAYRDEEPDGWLVERHEREVFPLLKKRHLFSDVSNFLLYDFYTGEGHVNEDVFAYSNAAGHERALVIYHNRYSSTAGWIKTSAAYIGDAGNLVRKALAEGLGLSEEINAYSIFKDQMTGLEYIRSNAELGEKGLYVELGAFKYHVFLDFRQVVGSEERPYGKLAASLGGTGVPSIDDAMADLLLRPVTEPFREAINPGSLRCLADGITGREPSDEAVEALRQKAGNLLEGVKAYEKSEKVDESIVGDILGNYGAVQKLAIMLLGENKTEKAITDYIGQVLPAKLTADLRGWRTILVSLFVRALTGIKGGNAELLHKWRLEGVIINSFAEMGMHEGQIESEVLMIRILAGLPEGINLSDKESLKALLETDEARSFIKVNTHDGIKWFVKERFEELLFWLFIICAMRILKEEPESLIGKRTGEAFGIIEELRGKAASSAYQLKPFLEGIRY